MSKYIFEKILLASDHAGIKAKSYLVDFLKNYYLDPHSILDIGPFVESSTDYPLWASKLVESFKSDEKNGIKVGGILICGSGIGMSIAANRYKGIRATLCHDENQAQLAREHNYSNVLCLGARIVELPLMEKIVLKWLTVPNLESGNHQKRVNMLDNLRTGP